MSAVHFSTPLSAEHIDTINGVIRGVSVITSGLVARGHGLTVDGITLSQMHACACALKSVPVKIDHKSGAASVCGYLANFRRADGKLKADWFLLQTHPQRDQIIEVAQRMPRGVGLSASFVSPDGGEPGKARCAELISVDYVTLPAANPDGLFSRRERDRRELPLSGVEKVRRVLGAAGRGAEAGAVGGLAARLLLKRRAITADGAATAGAAVGALANGVLQYRKDRDLAGRVSTILFQQRAAVGRLIDATRQNVSVPVPGTDEAETVLRVAKRPLVRRVGARLLKIGAGAGLGYYAGRKIGARAGAVTGAVAGLLFSNAEVRNRVRLSVSRAKILTHL